MVNIKEQTLKDALCHIGLRELPKMASGTDAWHKAVVLVRRAVYFVQSYALCEKSPDGKILITNDFGAAYSCSSIEGNLFYFPYEFEEEEIVFENSKIALYAPSVNDMLSVVESHPETKDAIEQPEKKAVGRPKKTEKKTARKPKTTKKRTAKAK